jgi:hypothetical protein
VVANPQPVEASFCGIGLEPVGAYGTPVLPANYIPAKTLTPLDKLILLTDEGWRGAPVKTYGHTPGPLYAEYEIGGDVYADIIGYPVAGVLGDVVYSGTAAAPTGTLSAGSSVGAVSVSSSVSISSGTRIQIDVGVLSEVVTTTGVPTGAGPYAIPVPALKNAHLTGVAITAVTAPYTTVSALLCSGNFQPPSYTIFDWNSNITGYQLPGARFSELQFKFSGAGKLEYIAKATTLPLVVNGTKPAFSNPPTAIMPGWEGITKIGGVTVGYLVDGDYTIKRAIEVVDTVDGVQAPYTLFAGEVDVSGKLVIVMEDDSKRAAFTAGTSTAIDLNFLQGAGATTQQVLLHSTASYLTDAKVVRGKSYAELELTFEADANTTDIGNSAGFSPCKVTLQNQLAAGAYK